ncbi:hypothetical protein VPH35_039825 [Triticum aestivum]
MAEAHGGDGVAAGDVVELQDAVTTDVGGIHGGAGKLAIAADVDKEVAGSASALQKVTASSSESIPIPPMRNLESSRRRMMVGGERKLADYDPYDPEFSDDEEYEYDSGDNVYKGNIASFTTKEVEKIKDQGVASFYNRKIKKRHCPYCTTKPKPKDGRFDHLLCHAEDVSIRGEVYMIRGRHAALAKALTPG